MEYFKITKNGVEIKSALTSEEVSKIFPAIIEDHTDGYIYDDERGVVFNEVDNLIIARQGDNYAHAGDDIYEVIEDND